MSINSYKYTKLEPHQSTDGDSISDHEDVNPGHGYLRSLRHYATQPPVLLAFLNIVFISLWLNSAYFSKTDTDTCVRPQLTYSTARESDAIEYERRRLYRPLDNNPYTGHPRPEHDLAWAAIIEPLSTLITPSEYEEADLGAPTLGLRDGTGYVAEVAVYHELDCIRRVRHWLFRDHYHPNATVEERHQEDLAVETCLEYWRETALCHADASLATFFWRDGIPCSRAWSDHECVVWDKFDTWARSRMVDLTDPKVLDQTDRWKDAQKPDEITGMSDYP